MNKAALLQQIQHALLEELEGYARSARSAQAEATDEQSKAENKYDTRGLEASYLARGQSRQAMETTQAWQQFHSLAVRVFGAKEAIELGALLTVEHQGETVRYFLGPSAGGTEVTCEGEVVTVITPQSPLGLELLGKKVGGRATLPGRGRSQVYRVVAVE